VNYPDGGHSTFGASIESTFQEVVLSYDDAGAPPAGSRKVVFVTQSQINDPDFQGGVATQPPNIVRRVVNGSGEVVYRNWENSGDPNVLYTFEAPQKLTRITTSNGYPVQIAHGPAGFNPSTGDPTSVTYDVIESYQPTPTTFLMNS